MREIRGYATRDWVLRAVGARGATCFPQFMRWKKVSESQLSGICDLHYFGHCESQISAFESICGNFLRQLMNRAFSGDRPHF